MKEQFLNLQGLTELVDYIKNYIAEGEQRQGEIGHGREGRNWAE